LSNSWFQTLQVKVLSISGNQKISLSMKDVDQDTGEDLNPMIQPEDLK